VEKGWFWEPKLEFDNRLIFPKNISNKKQWGGGRVNNRGEQELGGDSDKSPSKREKNFPSIIYCLRRGDDQ